MIPVNGEAVARGLIVLIILSLHVDMILPLQIHFLCSASTAAGFDFFLSVILACHFQLVDLLFFYNDTINEQKNHLINNAIVNSEQLSVPEGALKLSSGLTNSEVV